MLFIQTRTDIYVDDKQRLHENSRNRPEVQVFLWGAYFNVLRVLGLQDDFLKLAGDDEFRKKLQDLKLIGKSR